METIVGIGVALIVVWALGWWAFVVPIGRAKKMVADDLEKDPFVRPSFLVRQLSLLILPILAWFAVPGLYRLYCQTRDGSSSPPLSPIRYFAWVRLVFVELGFARLPLAGHEPGTCPGCGPGGPELQARHRALNHLSQELCPWLEQGFLDERGDFVPPRWS